MWRVRRTFWNWLLVLRFKLNTPEHIPIPTDDGIRMATIPLGERYPAIPISNIPVSSRVPADENKPVKLVLCRIQAALCRLFPQNQPNLPPISDDQDAAIDRAFSVWRRRVFPAPVRPEEYRGRPDLGFLAVAGPYFCFLEQSPDGGYQWDLRHLDGYEVHDGLRPLGTRVLFEVDEERRRLEARQIECDLGTVRPGDGQWEEAQRLALCAATNFLSLIRHYCNVHLATVAQLTVATRTCLPTDHALRRLLQPHAWGTEYTMEAVTQLLMMKEGDFANVFSFTHEGMCRLFQDWYERYDIRVIDPEVDAERRGVVGKGFDLPALTNRLAHLEVMRAHTRRYLAVYYLSDEAVRDDRAVMSWVNDLDRRLPGDCRPLIGDPVTIEGLARLVAAFIHLSTVEHQAIGQGLWNYQLWTDVQPVRVYANGQREPVDVFQRLVNYNLLLNVHRAPLVQDFSYLAVDEEGRRCFKTFYAELQALQARLDQEDRACWKMCPRLLESSVNG